MFDKLEDLVRRFEEITNELTEPSVVNDQNRFRKLMKEQSDLQPLVDAYTAVSYTHLDVYKRQIQQNS